MDIITQLKRGRRLARGKGRVSKGVQFGRTIKEETIIGFHFRLHATKGWRQESPKRQWARAAMAAMRA